MGESEADRVCRLVKSMGGYKGQIGLQYTKMDHNWDSLRGSPTSKVTLDTLRKHFSLAEANVQKCRDIYVEIGTIVDEDTYNTQYQPKYTDMETKPEEKEEQMEKADQVYKRALRDQAPDPPPPPVDGGGARAPFIPKIEMKLARTSLQTRFAPWNTMLGWKSATSTSR